MPRKTAGPTRTTKRRKLLEPPPAKLVVAIMWQPLLEVESCLREVSKVYGKIINQTAVFDFKQTTYYAKEMGEGLKKCFVEIEGLCGRDELVKFKHQATHLENQFLDGEKRTLNIDPMLVTTENIVISTSKPFPHRAYLGEGIYADVHFVRRGGKYESLPWTYADYVQNLEFFEKVREGLQRELALL